MELLAKQALDEAEFSEVQEALSGNAGALKKGEPIQIRGEDSPEFRLRRPGESAVSLFLIAYDHG
jgi:hypothetical protein